MNRGRISIGLRSKSGKIAATIVAPRLRPRFHRIPIKIRRQPNRNWFPAGSRSAGRPKGNNSDSKGGSSGGSSAVAYGSRSFPLRTVKFFYIYIIPKAPPLRVNMHDWEGYLCGRLPLRVDVHDWRGVPPCRSALTVPRRHPLSVATGARGGAQVLEPKYTFKKLITSTPCLSPRY